MAEITSALATNKQGIRLHKKSTRVDLTPMVDLGFLLITFFIITTRLSEPKAMKLLMPADGDGSKIGETAALTLLPSSGQVYYYHGSLELAIKSGEVGTTSYDMVAGIGKLIRDKQNQMERFKAGSSQDLMLLVKPTSDASYGDFVNVLDEVKINGLKHYAIMNLDPTELQRVISYAR